MHRQDVDTAAKPLVIVTGQTKFGKDIVIKHKKNSQMYYIEVGGAPAKHQLLDGSFTSVKNAQTAISTYHNEVETLPPTTPEEKAKNELTVAQLREIARAQSEQTKTVVADGVIETKPLVKGDPDFIEKNLE